MDAADEAHDGGRVPGMTTPASRASGRHQQRRNRRAGVLIGLLSGLLGFGLVVQVQSTESQAGLGTARQEDLVRILDDLNARDERLRREIGELEATRRELGSGAAGDDAALNEARRRARELGILAGTVPATGPGLVVTIREHDRRLPADLLLDAVQELRGAGAEAIQVTGADGAAVRIGASSWFVDGNEGIVIDDRQLRAPYTVVAIGDPPTMDAALRIPGGVEATVQQADATVRIEQRPKVAVTALREVKPPQYARPAS